MLAGAPGMAIGAVGLDPPTAEERVIFGIVELRNGISFVAVTIRLFGVSEAPIPLRSLDIPAVKRKIDRIVPSWRSMRRHLSLTVPSPGIGAFIPMLTFGIPGDAVTAFMIGALFIHGLGPGPMPMAERPQMFWFLVGALLLSTFFPRIFGLAGIRFFTKVVELPKGAPMPPILALSVVGASAVNHSAPDAYRMPGFGVPGCFVKLYGCEIGPAILGASLFRLFDENRRRAIISRKESLPAHFLDTVQSPLSLVRLLAVLLIPNGRIPLRPAARAAFARRRARHPRTPRCPTSSSA